MKHYTLGNLYFNEFIPHLSPRPLIDNFPNYILLNIWVSEPCERKMHLFIMMCHWHNQSAKYVLEPNVNEIYFSFPIVTQVQREETSSVDECFLFIFLISKCWINVNQKLANLLEIYTWKINSKIFPISLWKNGKVSLGTSTWSFLG